MPDIVQFPLNRPIEVALQFAEPKIVESKFDRDGRAMFALATPAGHLMFHDMLTAAKIKALGVQPGELFFIQKTKNGRLTEYSVFRESSEPPAENSVVVSSRKPVPPHVREATLVDTIEARNASRRLEQTLEASIAQATEAKQPVPVAANNVPVRDPWAGALLQQVNQLVDTFAAALAHSSASHGNAVKPEDVRSILLSAYINASKQQGVTSRAAA
jgi:hypothetical protein